MTDDQLAHEVAKQEIVKQTHEFRSEALSAEADVEAAETEATEAFQRDYDELMARRAAMTPEQRKTAYDHAMAFLESQARRSEELAANLAPGVYEIAPGHYFIKKDPGDHWSISG